jgi:hypothetical protein
MPGSHAEAVALNSDGYMTTQEYLDYCRKNGFDPEGPLHQKPNPERAESVQPPKGEMAR